MSNATKGLRRAGIGGLTAAVALGTLIASGGVANATSSFDLSRLAGTGDNANRYGTSAAIAGTFKTVNGAVNDVVLAGAAPDALSASVLAGVKGAPILLTQKDSLPDVVKTAIANSGAKNVWIVGGTAVVSQAQEDAIKALGYNVVRISGINRFATAEAIIAKAASTATVGLVANGDGFADALAASPLAYSGKHPMFLVHKDSIPAETLQAMKDSGVKSVLVLGGVGAVSQAVRDQISAAGFTIADSFPGKDRSETSQLIANYELANASFSKTAFHLATGKQTLGGVDALSAGPLAGSVKQPVLLTDAVGGVGAVDDFATAHKADLSGTGFVFGGSAAVPDSVVTTVETAAGTGQFQSIAVSPSTAVNQVVSADATKNDGARTYTVNGLDASKKYAVALVPAANVTADGRFTAAGTISADAGTSIETVNGAPVVLAADGVGKVVVTGVAPVNGQLTFSVDSVDVVDLVPVVFYDVDGNGALTFSATPTSTKPLASTDAYGLGGEINYVPAESESTTLTDPDEIVAVDKAANSITGTAASYKYDDNDLFYVGGSDPADQVTLADFEKVLTAGDSVAAGTIYKQTSAFQSTFILSNDAPTFPTVVTADTTTTDTTATLTLDADTIADGATVNVYRAASGADFDTATKVASVTTDADSTTDGFQVVVNGLTADTDYTLYVTQTVDGEESGEDGGTAVSTTLATDSAVTVSNVSVGSDINDGANSSSEIVVKFTKKVTDAADDGLTVYPTAQPGITIASTGAVVSSDGLTVTYTLATALSDASTDVNYTAVVAAASVTTADGVNAKSTGTFSY